MKYKNKNFIINYIKEFNKINLDTSNQLETLNQIIEVLKKYKKKIQYIFLVMVVVPV